MALKCCRIYHAPPGKGTPSSKLSQPHFPGSSDAQARRLCTPGEHRWCKLFGDSFFWGGGRDPLCKCNSCLWVCADKKASLPTFEGCKLSEEPGKMLSGKVKKCFYFSPSRHKTTIWKVFFFDKHNSRLSFCACISMLLVFSFEELLIFMWKGVCGGFERFAPTFMLHDREGVLVYLLLKLLFYHWGGSYKVSC